MTEKRRISDIKIGKRIRQDLGDIAGLAHDIAVNGLIQPVAITSDGLLIAGQRRLAALELLGREEVPVRIIDIGHNTPADLARGEISENEIRLDFNQQERKAAGLRARAAVAEHPEKSDRAIAEEIAVSPTTVGKARKEQLSSGQLGQSTTAAPRTGKDGKTRRSLPTTKEPVSAPGRRSAPSAPKWLAKRIPVAMRHPR